MFFLEDLGLLTYFLGVEVTTHAHGLFFTQRCYILDLLTRACMTSTKPIATPLATSLTLWYNII